MPVPGKRFLGVRDELKVRPSLDPHGCEVQGMLSCRTPIITTEQLLEIVTEEVKKILPGTLTGKARQNVLVFLIGEEYKSSNIKDHIRRAAVHRSTDRWKEINPCDNHDRVEVFVQKYKQYVGDDGDDGSVEETPEIDKVVATGHLTALHIAASNGDMEEVRHLIEWGGANPRVLDNQKKTPLDRARWFGHIEVAEYLKVKMG